MPEEREVAFDPDSKMMATYHRRDGRYFVAAKGAPEATLGACSRLLTAGGPEPLDDEGRDWWMERNAAMAAEGLRVLGEWWLPLRATSLALHSVWT